jgi:D-methionine transport system ATP-binding protein
MIELINVCKTYSSKKGSHCALHNVNLKINDGEIYGIIGQSGAGKSTLVRCINLLEQPSSGKVLIDGEDVTCYKGIKLRDLRKNIGMIFQNFSLYQQRTVLDNVLFPLKINKVSKSDSLRRAIELLDIVGLSEKIDCYPSQLSGGQQQRVAIARALANNPNVLLCDEATSALDTRTTLSVLKLLQKINKELGVTIILITHSLAVARSICTHIAVLDEGKLVEEGPTLQILNNPKSKEARELVEYDRLAV